MVAKELKVPVLVTVQGRKIPIDGNPEEVISSWCFQSESNPDKAYDVILRRSGEVSCPCPGWIFKRAGQSRDCKHLRAAAADITRVRQLFKAGAPLPVYEAPAPSAKAQKKAVYAAADLEVGVLRTRRMITIE